MGAAPGRRRSSGRTGLRRLDRVRYDQSRRRAFTLGTVPRFTRQSKLDLLIALGLAVWALVEALALDGPSSTGVRVAWALAYALPLASRRRFPLGVALA